MLRASRKRPASSAEGVSPSEETEEVNGGGGGDGGGTSRRASGRELIDRGTVDFVNRCRAACLQLQASVLLLNVVAL